MRNGNYAYHLDQNSKLKTLFCSTEYTEILVWFSQAAGALNNISQLIFVIEVVVVFIEGGRYICQNNVDEFRLSNSLWHGSEVS